MTKFVSLMLHDWIDLNVRVLMGILFVLCINHVGIQFDDAATAFAQLSIRF